VQQAIHANTPGYIKVELDNSRSQFATPPSKGSEVVLKLGYKTSSGNEVSDAGHYWLADWEYSITQQTRQTLTLFCIDAWGLASAWSARYSLRWNYTAAFPCYVWVILYQLLGRAGIRLWNNPDVTKSNSMDNYQPKFLVRGGSHGHIELRRLLTFVTDGLIQREALTFVKDLLSTEASSYEYRNAPGYHSIIKGSYGENLTITHTQVSGETDEDPPTPVREAAFDWENLARGIDNLIMQYDPNLEETAQAQHRADALLRAEAQKSLGGQIIVPINCGQELYDVVTITDSRVGNPELVSGKKYRILDIQTDYDHRRSIYQQRLALGAP